MAWTIRWVALVFLSLALIEAPAEAAKRPTRPDCKLMREQDRADGYITNFYLTTFGSAWFEGATQGFGEGLAGRGNTAEAIRKAMLRPEKTPDALFNELPTNLKPYCRIYETDRLAVAQATAKVVAMLGNRVLISNVRAGIFKTDVIDREHIAAKWKDSYILTVTDEGPDQVIVKVLRTVMISRDGQTYNQGVSSGHNEKWILGQIGDLAR